LVSSKRNNKRPEFFPESCRPNELAAAWDEMESMEQTHERKLLDKYLAFQRADRGVSKFNTKAATLDAWLDEKLQTFTRDFNTSVQEIEAQLEVHRGFEERYGLYERTLQELSHIATELETVAASGHAGAQHVAAHMQSLQTKMNLAKEEGAEYRKKLETALAKEQKLIALEKEYLSKLDQFEFEFNGLVEQVAEFGSEGLTVSEIQKMSVDIKQFPEEIEKFNEKSSELASIASQIDRKQPDAVAHVQEIQNRIASISTSLAEKETTLHDALQEEQRKDELKQKFAMEANKFHSYCNAKQQSLSDISGDLEQQLEQINATRDNVFSEGSDKLEQLKSSAEECDKANIVVNSYTPHTINSLTAQFDQVLKSFKLTSNSVEAQIVAKKSLELSSEQLHELKEVFSVFDNDHDGTLNIQEFREAILGIGIDIEDVDFEKRFSTKIEFSMDDFIQFFIEVNKSGDSKEDILNAFRNLGGGGETMSSEAVDKYFAQVQDVQQYLHSNLLDGNYADFVEKLYLR